VRRLGREVARSAAEQRRCHRPLLGCARSLGAPRRCEKQRGLSDIVRVPDMGQRLPPR
jgi:hypothetical protein